MSQGKPKKGFSPLLDHSPPASGTEGKPLCAGIARCSERIRHKKSDAVFGRNKHGQMQGNASWVLGQAKNTPNHHFSILPHQKTVSFPLLCIKQEANRSILLHSSSLFDRSLSLHPRFCTRGKRKLLKPLFSSCYEFHGAYF